MWAVRQHVRYGAVSTQHWIPACSATAKRSYGRMVKLEEEEANLVLVRDDAAPKRAIHANHLI